MLSVEDDSHEMTHWEKVSVVLSWRFTTHISLLKAPRRHWLVSLHTLSWNLVFYTIFIFPHIPRSTIWNCVCQGGEVGVVPRKACRTGCGPPEPAPLQAKRLDSPGFGISISTCGLSLFLEGCSVGQMYLFNYMAAVPGTIVWLCLSNMSYVPMCILFMHTHVQVI